MDTGRNRLSFGLGCIGFVFIDPLPPVQTEKFSYPLRAFAVGFPCQGVEPQPPLGVLQERFNGFTPVSGFYGISWRFPAQGRNALIHPALPVSADDFRQLLLNFRVLHKFFMFL